MSLFVRAALACAIVCALCGTAHSFGKNKVNREVFDWEMLRTIHFDVYYPRGMDALGAHAGRLCEEGYVHIANYLRHELTDPVPVIIYPSHIAFQENNIIPNILGEGTGGFTESFKTRVVVPFNGSYADLRHVLTHELVHAFQYNILFNDTTGALLSRFGRRGLPLWIMEGMAEYLSIGYDDTADMVMRDIIFNDKFATLADLTKYNIHSGYLLYKQGQSFYYYLEETYGRWAIGEFFRDVRDVGDLDTVFLALTGKTMEEVSLDYVRYFKRRYYPIIDGKKFEEEEGEQITHHLKTRSSFNSCPAVSPDGARIAFLSNTDVYSNVVIVDITKKKKERTITTLVEGETSSRFEGMHLLSNNLSWSRDGKRLAFVAQSHGRDAVFIVDPANGRVLDRIELDFRAVLDPALSPDGGSIAFIGQGDGAADLYLYRIAEKKLSRITNDRFSERHPRISAKGDFLVYSSNWNEAGDVERGAYNIYRHDIATGERTTLVASPGNDLQADLSHDDSRIVFISNRKGIYNAYVRDLSSGEESRLTNVLCGVFYPRWFPDGTRIAYVGYQNLGYDIFTREAKGAGGGTDNSRETPLKRVDFPAAYFDMKNAAQMPYAARITNDFIAFGVAATTGYGLAGIAQAGFSDFMGDHRVIFTANYFQYNENGVLNFDAVYFYLKHRWDFGAGVFRKENPFGVFSLETINELIHNVYWDTERMYHYGAYGIARYPFTRFARMNLRATMSRYEVDYTEYSPRTDVAGNLHQVSASLSYDNVIWGYLGPLDGIRGQAEVEEAIPAGADSFDYGTVSVDIRTYFLIRKRYVLALRGSAGHVFGRDSQQFKYYLGGFTNLRGYPFFEFSGENVFFTRAEFRFILVEHLKFGWPLFFRMVPIGGVLFADAGSVWNRNVYRFNDPETGKFDDFKVDFGFGFRITLFPIIFKLDYAWPYNNKSFDSMRVLFSIGMVYWD